MAKKKRKSTKKPVPHCKRVTIKTGPSAGKKKNMCFGANGKLTSKAKVDAYKKRKKAA